MYGDHLKKAGMKEGTQYLLFSDIQEDPRDMTKHKSLFEECRSPQTLKLIESFEQIEPLQIILSC